MNRFVFIMSHELTPEQRAAAESSGTIMELAEKPLLVVPDDPALSREWFVQRAEQILAAVGGIQTGDTFHIMGQQNLCLALEAAAKRGGATLVESVTRRESLDVHQVDGSVKKTNVFRFCGFRPVYDY